MTSSGNRIFNFNESVSQENKFLEDTDALKNNESRKRRFRPSYKEEKKKRSRPANNIPPRSKKYMTLNLRLPYDFERFF